MTRKIYRITALGLALSALAACSQTNSGTSQMPPATKAPPPPGMMTPAPASGTPSTPATGTPSPAAPAQ